MVRTMHKILAVFGTRPDTIKMAPLIKHMESRKEFRLVTCTTGQHRDMLRQVLDVFCIRPDYDLDIMKETQTLEYITYSILEKMGIVLDRESPGMVLVHGDTTTCFASALSSFYHGVHVGHVEAGLRSHDIRSPFPEEMNRILTGKLASVHFAPTQSNKLNLLNEGIREQDIYVTGNTVIDALASTVSKNHVFSCEALNRIDFLGKRVITLTVHRRENIGVPLENICRAVANIADRFQDVQFVYPVHPNSAVRKIVYSLLSGKENVLLTEPVDILDSHNLIDRSYFVMTDSGGLQEEAPALGKPVLVLRRETERPEVLEAGAVKLTGILEKEILRDAMTLLHDETTYRSMARAVHPFGDGHASRRIADGLVDFFSRA